MSKKVLYTIILLLVAVVIAMIIPALTKPSIVFACTLLLHILAVEAMLHTDPIKKSYASAEGFISGLVTELLIAVIAVILLTLSIAISIAFCLGGFLAFVIAFEKLD